MALIKRLSRLFLADFHAVLDRIEDPEALLKQAMREMEEDLLSTEATIKYLTAESESIHSKRAGIEQTLCDINEKLSLCFAAENDELARPLIKQQLERQNLLKSLKRHQDSLGKQLIAQQTQHQENQSLYESVRQKAELFTQEMPSREGELRHFIASTQAELAVSDADIEQALWQQKMNRKPAADNMQKSKGRVNGSEKR